MQKKSSTITKKLDEIASLFGLPTSTEVTGMPSLPTLAEMMEEPRSPTSLGRPKGLFEELLGGNLAALYQDMLLEREKYEPEVVELVQQLMQQKRELTQDERALLDRAVLDFNRRLPVKAAPTKPPTQKKLEPHVEDEHEGDLPTRDAIPGVDIPMGVEKPFWWL